MTDIVERLRNEIEAMPPVFPQRVVMAEAADEIEQLRERFTWQPIATAPRDGTVVLLWDGLSMEPGRWWDDVWTSMHEQHPTHWMPLPDRPEAK